MVAALRECKKTLEFKDGKRRSPCPHSGFVSCDRPKQTQYCDQCKLTRDQERRQENRDFYKAKYDPEAAAYKRARWAETHRGQTWAQYIAERRSQHRERVQDSNRRAAAKYRAKQKRQKAENASRSRAKLAALACPSWAESLSKKDDVVSKQHDFSILL